MRTWGRQYMTSLRRHDNAMHSMYICNPMRPFSDPTKCHLQLTIFWHILARSYAPPGQIRRVLLRRHQPFHHFRAFLFLCAQNAQSSARVHVIPALQLQMVVNGTPVICVLSALGRKQWVTAKHKQKDFCALNSLGSERVRVFQY